MRYKILHYAQYYNLYLQKYELHFSLVLNQSQQKRIAL